MFGSGCRGGIWTVTIGNQRAEKIVAKNVARNLTGTRRVVLKVNEILVAVNPEVRAFSICDPVRFIRVDGSIAAGELLSNIINNRFGLCQPV